MTVEERGTTFVLTNTWVPTDPDDPDNPPQTGDSPNIMLYILFMFGAGSLLIIVGFTGKKARL
jgi:LPXTG-motif cell wall-anchored protein